MSARSMIVDLVAADGRAATNPKTTPRISDVVESASQRIFSEFAANGARSDSARADKILLNTEMCLNASTASSAANVRRNPGKGFHQSNLEALNNPLGSAPVPGAGESVSLSRTFQSQATI